MTVRNLLIRGMLCGLFAGLVGAVVAKLIGEGAVGQAILFESHKDAADGMASGPELVSRTVQNTVGLLTGMLVFGVAIGGLFALAYACVQGRLGRLGARATALLVALGGFGSMYLIPGLKYPANPPSIGNPDTIGHRTAMYFLMMALALLVVIGATIAAHQLSARFGTWNGALVAIGGGVVVIGLAYAWFPAIHETPDGFPADVLWKFRIASYGIQVAVWSSIGLLFGALTERSLKPKPVASGQAMNTSPTANAA
jgi:hypothetical protein